VARVAAVVRPVLSALACPEGADAFAHARSLTKQQVTGWLREAHLEGHLDEVWHALEGLRQQPVATGEELNAKFAADGTGKIEQAYGNLQMFFAGLEVRPIN